MGESGRGEEVMRFILAVLVALCLAGTAWTNDFVNSHDTNGDGAVSLSEFPGSRAGFIELDTNRDRLISPNEAPGNAVNPPDKVVIPGTVVVNPRVVRPNLKRPHKKIIRGPKDKRVLRPVKGGKHKKAIIHKKEAHNKKVKAKKRAIKGAPRHRP